MMASYSCFLNWKVSWVIKCILPLFILFLLANKATAGLVWETTKAPIIDGNILYANSAYGGGMGKLVGMDFNDPTPNPCYHQICNIYVGVNTNYNNRGALKYLSLAGGAWGSAPPPGPIDTHQIYLAKTMGEVYKFMDSQPGDKGLHVGRVFTGHRMGSGYYCDPGLASYYPVCEVKERWHAYSTACYALGYVTANIGSSYVQAFPGQGCIGPNPPNNECNIDAGAVTLDHGQLGTEEVNGHRKRESFRISCTYPANAEVSVVSNTANEKIMLKGDGSLYSTVTLDGVPGITGKKITIPTGGVPIDLESTLHTVGNIEEGPFSGNGILIINAY
ncbi:MrpH family fimbial adhesin [Serratia nevei]|uniref:MrpH family fimbial adhesin n=1 Tax=Serratia nevei TaxID=2703794 RepID=UPI003FA6ABFF